MVVALELARIRQFCDDRTPACLRDEMRFEADVRGKSITILGCRPPWRPNLTDWSRLPSSSSAYEPDTHSRAGFRHSSGSQDR
jgi:hypothetical protein